MALASESGSDHMGNMLQSNSLNKVLYWWNFHIVSIGREVELPVEYCQEICCLQRRLHSMNDSLKHMSDTLCLRFVFP
jgi:hypothetical protein